MSVRRLSSPAALPAVVPTNTSGLVYTQSGWKPATIATLLVDGLTAATATVDPTGTATWTLTKAPRAGAWLRAVGTRATVYQTAPVAKLTVTGAAKPGIKGGPYSLAPAISGGVTPYAVTVSPALPFGLALDGTTGIVSAPALTGTGTYAGTLTVTDAAGTVATLALAFTVYAGAASNLPSLAYVLDPAAATQTAALSPGVPGIQVDASGNVLAVNDAASGVAWAPATAGAGFTLASGGPGGYPVFHGAGAGRPLMLTTTTELDKFFAASGQPYAFVLVYRETAATYTRLLMALTAGDLSSGVQIGAFATNQSDATLTYVGQNNGGAGAAEGTAVALNQLQILSVLCDGTRFYAFRNGALVLTTNTGAVGGCGVGGIVKMFVCDSFTGDVSLIEIARACPSQAQHNAELQALASKYGITGILTVSAGPSAAVAPLTVPTTDLTQQWLTTPSFPSLTPPVVAGNALGSGLKLKAGAANLGTLRFGGVAGANVPDRAALDSYVYYNPFTGNQGAVTGNDGIEGVGGSACYGRARRYAEGNAYDLHVLLPDGLHLRAVGANNNAPAWTNGNVYAGMIRLPWNILPGMTVKIRSRSPLDNLSWMAMWLYGGYQISPLIANGNANPYQGYGTASSLIWPSSYYMEIDIDDNYTQAPETAKGHEFDATSISKNDNPAMALSPFTVFKPNGSGIVYHANQYSSYVSVAGIDKSDGIHEHVFNWRGDGSNLLDYLVDGNLILTQYYEYAKNIGSYVDAGGVTRQIGTHLLITQQPIPVFAPGVTSGGAVAVADNERFTGVIEEIALFQGNVDLSSAVVPPGTYDVRIAGTPGQAVANVAYTFTPAAAGGKGPLTFSYAGDALPSGWSFSTATGTVSGTTSQGGTINGTITATDGITSKALTVQFASFSPPAGYAVPARAIAYHDFVRDAATDKTTGVTNFSATGLTVARSSVGYDLLASTKFAANVARRTGAGLLVEAAATNLAPQSEFAGGWTTSSASLTANAATAPNGTTTAAKLAYSTTNTSGSIRQSGGTTLTVGQTYFEGVFAKAGEISYVSLDSYDGAKDFGVVYNLSTGAVASTRTGANTGAPAASGMIAVGGGWYWCWFSFVATATGGSQYQFQVGFQNVASPYGGISGSATVGQGVYVWGFDYKQATALSSYVPTGTAAATRAADAITRAIPAGVGHVDLVYDTGATVTVAVTAGGTYTLPVNPAGANLKTLEMYP